MNKKLWSQKHPIFYFAAIWTKRIRRYLDWSLDGKKYCKTRSSEKLPFRVKKHSSVLI